VVFEKGALEHLAPRKISYNLRDNNLTSLLPNGSLSFLSFQSRILEKTRGVRFVMDEGSKFSIGKILFEGNRAFSEMELWDALKLNKEHSSGTSFDNTNIYVKEKLGV
jgi:hypothetical protein